MTRTTGPVSFRRLIASLLVCLPAAACMPLQVDGTGVQSGVQPPVTLDQAEAGVHRRLGLTLESAGDIAGAVDEFETALNLGRWSKVASADGVDDNPYGDLTRICGRRDAAADVVRACNRAIGYAALDRRLLADLIANRGDAYERLGDHERALNNYETVLKLESNDPRGLFGRGRMRAWADDHGRAIIDFSRVISTAPDLLEARFARARSLAALRDFDAAIADYDHVLTDPELLAAHPDAYRDRAQVHCMAGQADAAAIGWQVWLAATPGGVGYVQEMLRAQGYLRGPTGPEFDAFTLGALRAWTSAGCVRE